MFAYDPGRGLFVPGAAAEAAVRYKAGPNPTSPPPIDRVWHDELRRMCERTGRQLRFGWMKGPRIHSIEVLEGIARGWETVVCNYDENGAWEGNPYPYRKVDKRFFDEINESDLRIQYGTGDPTKDALARDKAVREREAKKKEDNFNRGAQLIEDMVTGGDHRRFFRLLGHEHTHNGPGVRFTEYFQVHKNTPMKDTVPSTKE